MTTSGTPAGTWRGFGKRQLALFLLLTAYSGAQGLWVLLPAHALPVGLQTWWGPGEEGREGGTLPCLSSENPQAWPQPLSSPTTPQAHKAPFPEPCQSRGKGRGPALRASVLHPPTGPMHSHVHTHTEQGREHSRSPSQHCGRWKAQTHAHLLPAQARSSRGLGRDPLRQDRSSPDSCLHLSSLLHQPVPAEPGSPLRPPTPGPCLSVCLQPARLQPAWQGTAHPHPALCLVATAAPQQDPVPSPSRAAHHGPAPTHPSPTPHLAPSSVSLSVGLSVPLPSSPHPLGPSQPSVSHPSLPRQPFPARQSPPVCLSVPQPIHPSVCRLIHHATATCPNLPPFASFRLDPLRCPQPALGRVSE